MESALMSGERTNAKSGRLMSAPHQDPMYGLSEISSKPEGTVKVIPQKPKRKHRRALEESVQSASSSQQNEVKDDLDERLLIAPPSGAQLNIESSVVDNSDDLNVHKVIQAEVHRAVKPVVIKVGASPTKADSNVSSNAKSNHRENRRRQRQKENVDSSQALSESEVAKSGAEKLQLKSSTEALPGIDCVPHGNSVFQDSADVNSGLGITIHRADRLEMNFNIKHPLVRVHVVDGTIGAYLKKSRKDRQVTAVYENRNLNVDFIMAVMTQPCDFNRKRSVFPVWEETLLYNEDFSHFVSTESNVIIFFEILDFLPMSLVNKEKSNSSLDGSWYRIAWAFLKVVGANKKVNCGRRLQLQLFHVPKIRIRPEPKVLDIFQWWSQLPRIQYPATLYVTLTRLRSLNEVAPAMRSMAPTQEERGSDSKDIFADKISSSSADNLGVMAANAGNRKSVVEWSRLPGQSCKIPNKEILRLTTAKYGCSTAKFSNNGRLIACACKNEAVSTILIYEVPSGILNCTLSGHTGIIYDINWSKLDNLLLSASADGTARIWKSLNGKFVEAEQLLPHPSFVYCSAFHQNNESIIVTGCYDSFVRFWFMPDWEDSPQLSQELEGHCGHVNTLAFDQEGSMLFSADSKGVICAWTAEKDNSNQGENFKWALSYKMDDQELMHGVSIISLIHHPQLQRILIHSLDGALRMFDYNTRNCIQTYNGCLNLRKQLRGCITPCGGLIFACSEDGRVHVWNTITGQVTATYSNLPHRDAIRCVIFHPQDHIIAFCYYGRNVPVIIYKYSFEVTEAANSRSERLVFSNLPQFQELSLPSMASTYLEKVISKLDSVVKSSISMETSKRSETNDMRNVLETTVTSWDTTFETFSSADEQNLWATAQYDYSAQRSDELALRKGDRIKILRKESQKWWIGLLDSGKKGFLPANYVLIENNNKDNGSDEQNKEYNVTTVFSKPSHSHIIASDSEEGSIE